mmetsp:Transcript_33324/g.51703  ORF Transcript_33324/g.51703 Transcript_33324/m.51703 type:complete len:386 (+) Transcript_33324:2329-3486(+)
MTVIRPASLVDAALFRQESVQDLFRKERADDGVDSQRRFQIVLLASLHTSAIQQEAKDGKTKHRGHAYRVDERFVGFEDASEFFGGVNIDLEWTETLQILPVVNVHTLRDYEFVKCRIVTIPFADVKYLFVIDRVRIRLSTFVRQYQDDTVGSIFVEDILKHGIPFKTIQPRPDDIGTRVRRSPNREHVTRSRFLVVIRFVLHQIVQHLRHHRHLLSNEKFQTLLENLIRIQIEIHLQRIHRRRSDLPYRRVRPRPRITFRIVRRVHVPRNGQGPFVRFPPPVQTGLDPTLIDLRKGFPLITFVFLDKDDGNVRFGTAQSQHVLSTLFEGIAYDEGPFFALFDGVQRVGRGLSAHFDFDRIESSVGTIGQGVGVIVELLLKIHFL